MQPNRQRERRRDEATGISGDPLACLPHWLSRNPEEHERLTATSLLGVLQGYGVSPLQCWCVIKKCKIKTRIWILKELV